MILPAPHSYPILPLGQLFAKVLGLIAIYCPLIV
jgi:hypothetical protein